MNAQITLTPEMRMQLMHAQTLTIDVSEFVVDAYKDGFMKGYEQQECLIDPSNEASQQAAIYAI